MKVSVRTSGLITAHLPGSDREDGIQVELSDGATVGALMDRLGLPGDKAYLVVVNDAAVPKARRESHGLNEGDRISIVPPLKGG